MATYEQESDFVHWVLYSGPFSYPSYNVEIIQEDGDYSAHQGEYFRNYNSSNNSNVDNDEIIARTLQDDFMQLGIAENSQNSYDQGNYLQRHPDEFVWHDRPYEHSVAEWVENDHDGDRFDESVHISSSSSPSDSEDCLNSWEPSDEYELDSEVGRRLNDMVSIPHVPRINGEIPSEDIAVSDHERLLNRLQLYGFVELKVQGDGNCQFRALSDQLYNTPERHKLVRRHIVNQLKSHREIYEGYVPMDYSDYLKKMSRSGEWGDHVTLQAAADTYRVKILVMTSFKDTCYIEIVPKSETYKVVIFLSFWAEVHYNSITFQGDTPSDDLKRKKKWWHFGN